MDTLGDLLVQLLQQTFGPRVELVDYQVAKRDRDYLVLLIQLCRPSLQIVVKLAGPEAPRASDFDRTAMLHRLVAAYTTIPMPEILAVDVSCRDWPWRYLIRTHIPGQEWAVVRQRMSAEELSGAYRQLGEAVAQLHTIRFPAFGELAADGSVRGEGTYLAALRAHAEGCIKSQRLRDLFHSALEKRRHLFLGVRDAGLCHEDLHQHNILFQARQGRWRLATILDFDKAWAGHPETDLARLDLWTGMTSQEFWEAYEAICPVDPLYGERRPIYQLLWCLECAWPTPEHIADTRRVCKELGLLLDTALADTGSHPSGSPARLGCTGMSEQVLR
jgi:Ser/Thr protein kinase RdoA (MazF antagonist)